MIHAKSYTIQEQLYQDVTQLFEEVVLRPNRMTIALPTGTTPTPFYARLVKQNNIDWSKITIFMLDSYYPQEPNDPESFYTYIKNNLLRHISLPEKNFHILGSNTKDPTVECSAYEEAINNAGGLDMAILGIGVNGHIAFNEPGTSFDSVTHLSKLQDQKYNYGLTMGIQTIKQAKKIILLATGKSKATAVKNAIEGPVSQDCPASFLQKHPDTTFFLDDDAASLLGGQ